MGVETALLATSIALSAGSTLASGYQAEKQGEYEQAQANADAQAAEAAGRVEAKRIREIARKQRGSARAALAASGVSVDMGTGEDLQREILQAGEQDAMTTILNGGTTGRRLRAEGAMAGMRGDQAMTGSLLAAGGDVAYGAYRWKRMSTGGND